MEKHTRLNLKGPTAFDQPGDYEIETMIILGCGERENRDGQLAELATWELIAWLEGITVQYRFNSYSS